MRNIVFVHQNLNQTKGKKKLENKDRKFRKSTQPKPMNRTTKYHLVPQEIMGKITGK